jgi:hypothetical protein
VSLLSTKTYECGNGPIAVIGGTEHHPHRSIVFLGREMDVKPRAKHLVMQTKVSHANEPLIGFCPLLSTRAFVPCDASEETAHSVEYRIYGWEVETSCDANSNADGCSGSESPVRDLEEVTTTQPGRVASAEWLTTLAVGKCPNINEI